MVFTDKLLSEAAAILEAARAKKLRLATAESCTGGLVAALLTEIAGSSDVFERGFITYSNSAKEELLGIPAPLLERFGAVSAECAAAMAEGALAHSHADIAVSITGIAGPSGGSPEKPVGLVFFGLGVSQHYVTTEKGLFSGKRHEVRAAALQEALGLLAKALANYPTA